MLTLIGVTLTLVGCVGFFWNKSCSIMCKKEDKVDSYGHCAGKSFWGNQYVMGGIIVTITIVLIVFGCLYQSMDSDHTNAMLVAELAKIGKTEQEIQRLLLLRQLSPREMQEQVNWQFKICVEQDKLGNERHFILELSKAGKTEAEIQNAVRLSRGELTDNAGQTLVDLAKLRVSPRSYKQTPTTVEVSFLEPIK